MMADMTDIICLRNLELIIKQLDSKLLWLIVYLIRTVNFGIFSMIYCVCGIL